MPGSRHRETPGRRGVLDHLPRGRLIPEQSRSGVQHRTAIRNRIAVMGTTQSTIRNRMLLWVGGEDRAGPPHGGGLPLHVTSGDRQGGRGHAQAASTGDDTGAGTDLSLSGAGGRRARRDEPPARSMIAFSEEHSPVSTLFCRHSDQGAPARHQEDPAVPREGADLAGIPAHPLRTKWTHPQPVTRYDDHTTAGELAVALGHSYIGCEHLLLAVAAAEGAAGEVLRGLGVTPQAVEAATLGLVGAPGEDLDRDALATIGIDLDVVRQKVEAVFGVNALTREPRRRSRWRRRRSCDPGSGHIPFTDRAKKCADRDPPSLSRSRLNRTKRSGSVTPVSG
ncbi:MAG: Clp protease N-terminal domain-containing protein [Pseudonocardiales bacterium]